MKHVVIHVGPGKCGSSAIQGFFSNAKSPCFERTYYKLLDPGTIRQLNRDDASEVLLAHVKEQIVSGIQNCDCLILSHECLFQSPNAIYNYCYLAKGVVEKVTIIGYSRRQSSFFKSQYSQWLFRAPERIREVNDTMTQIRLDQSVFTGLERHSLPQLKTTFIVQDSFQVVVFMTGIVLMAILLS